MNLTRETVSEWLEKHRRNREWLAEKCDTSVSNVGMWLNKKGTPREIPAEHRIKIHSLMEEDQAREKAKPPHNIVLDFTDSEFAAIEQAALEEKQTIREWAKRTLNESAKENAEQIVEILRQSAQHLSMVAEDPTPYGAKSGNGNMRGLDKQKEA